MWGGSQRGLGADSSVCRPRPNPRAWPRAPRLGTEAPGLPLQSYSQGGRRPEARGQPPGTGFSCSEPELEAVTVSSLDAEGLEMALSELSGYVALFCLCQLDRGKGAPWASSCHL